MTSHTLQQIPHVEMNPHDYNFSGTIYDDSTDNAPSTDDEQFLDHRSLLQSAPSRHSSVSSFPASVVHHAPNYDRPMTPSRSPFHNVRTGTPNQSPRPNSTGFRHPSSVRAMQMQDEFESTDCEELTPGHHRRNSKLSYLSYRSSGSHHSSPTKSLRMSRSAHTSPSKTRLKQEFPLVLLHCTLLQPSLNARARLLKSDANEKDSVLEAIIPEPYVKRWKALQDKVVKNSEVKLRGVLIPHPRDEYELLEERLLESLELERPRIREGHYLNADRPESATDSGFESGGTDSDSQHEETDESTNKCPDCGHKLSEGVEQERKWEVKVFAANGLMRAGAWSAAWSEMEKVDVEVGIWMPEEVRREVDERLEALIAKELEEKPKKEKKRRGMDEERAKEIYGESSKIDGNNIRSQAEIDGLADATEPIDRYQTDEKVNIQPEPLSQVHTRAQPDISTLLSNYIQLLAQDRRNIAILLLSILVLFYGFSHGKTEVSSGEVRSATDSSSGSTVLEVTVNADLGSTTSMSIVETATSAAPINLTSVQASPSLVEDAAMHTSISADSDSSESLTTGAQEEQASAVSDSIHELGQKDEEMFGVPEFDDEERDDGYSLDQQIKSGPSDTTLRQDDLEIDPSQDKPVSEVVYDEL